MVYILSCSTVGIESSWRCFGLLIDYCYLVRNDLFQCKTNFINICSLCQSSSWAFWLFYYRSKSFSISKIFILIIKKKKVICWLSLAYLCLCAYYTIFRIRIFNYFYLSLYHLTDENSLIFAATFLCRLTAPLCYNFLGMIHMDPGITNKLEQTETIFSEVIFIQFLFSLSC